MARTSSPPAKPQPSRRQTVQAGSVDANGKADYLSAGAGLSVTLEASMSVPVVVTAAKGYAGRGAVDVTAAVTSLMTISSLTASSTCYLYLDLSAGVGWGHTTLLPVYSYAAPSSPATGQHWFDLSAMRMKRWSGVSWEDKARVFIGQAVTGVSTVASVAAYALNGMAEVTATVVNNTNYNFNHNLGVVPLSVLGYMDTPAYGWVPFEFWLESSWASQSNGVTAYGYTGVSVSVTTGQDKTMHDGNRAGMTTSYASTDIRLVIDRGW